MKPLSQQYIYTNTEEALDYMDDCAKFIFPMVFVFMMLIYWTCYLYIIEDKLEMDTFWTNPYVIWYFYTRKMDYHNFLFCFLFVE